MAVYHGDAFTYPPTRHNAVVIIRHDVFPSLMIRVRQLSLDWKVEFKLELVLAWKMLYFATLRHGLSMDLGGPKHAADQSLTPVRLSFTYGKVRFGLEIHRMGENSDEQPYCVH